MMGKFSAFISQLVDDATGSIVVETAIVAPVLVTLGLGAYDVSRMIARQSELQAGSTDVEGIVLAVASGTATSTSTIKSVLMSSLSLPASQVTVVRMFRCNDNSSLVANATACGESDVRSSYVQVTLTDTFEPTWTKFGVGGAITYSLTRTVQVS